jgi:transposase
VRFAGVDIASEVHVVAVVDEAGGVLQKPTSFREDGEGYSKLVGLLGPAAEVLVAMEATGHYWQNLFAHLTAQGFEVVVLNPLRTRRFAGEDLARTKTDALDALSIARFAQQKRPKPARLPDEALEGLKELVRLRERLVQDMGDRVRQLHRLVDLGFPEFTRHVKTLESELATALLGKYPTAEAFKGVRMRELAHLKYDGRHLVGQPLAEALLAAAKVSVGAHHSEPYRLQVKYACEDIATLRERLRRLERDIEAHLEGHKLGQLMVQFEGLGPLTVAKLLAEVGNPAHFHSPKALVAYVGLCPGLQQSGKRQGQAAGLSRVGNGRVRRALWMPTLTAVRKNPWLRAYYEHLKARGKPSKVALVACMRKLMHALYAIAKSGKPFTYAPAP